MRSFAECGYIHIFLLPQSNVVSENMMPPRNTSPRECDTERENPRTTIAGTRYKF